MKLLIVSLTISIFSISCKKFLEIPTPPDKIAINQVFENDATATSAIAGIYSRMAVSGFASGNNSSVTTLGGLSADELGSYSSTLNFFYENELPTSSSQIRDLWSNIYTFIYSSNAILEGLPESTGVSETIKKQIEGEAKFIRGFCYFYLFNLFGEVPLILTSDYRMNEQMPRSSKDEIYLQIEKDLLDAENLLGTDYISAERIRPNKWVAKALLSRIYLYTNKWELAATKATEVIGYTTLYTLLSDLDQVFLKNSKETIWQLMPPSGLNTNEGTVFILTGTPSAQNLSLTPQLISAFDIPTDNRKVKWVKEMNNTTGKYYYAFKYKIRTGSIPLPVNEYSMVIRLAELYLIRAEARARLIQADLALQDINTIRNRAGLIVPITGLNPDQCLTEIEKQRQLELFSEWGHRWFDLKRTQRATVLLPLIKGATWDNTDILYPIPEDEINRNRSIVQNPGY